MPFFFAESLWAAESESSEFERAESEVAAEEEEEMLAAFFFFG